MTTTVDAERCFRDYFVGDYSLERNEDGALAVVGSPWFPNELRPAGMDAHVAPSVAAINDVPLKGSLSAVRAGRASMALAAILPHLKVCATWHRARLGETEYPGERSGGVRLIADLCGLQEKDRPGDTAEKVRPLIRRAGELLKGMSVRDAAAADTLLAEWESLERVLKSACYVGKNLEAKARAAGWPSFTIGLADFCTRCVGVAEQCAARCWPEAVKTPALRRRGPGRPRKLRAIDELVALAHVPLEEGKPAFVKLRFQQCQRELEGAIPTVACMAEILDYRPKTFARDAPDEHQLVRDLIVEAKRDAAKDSRCIEVRKKKPPRRA